MTYDGAAVFVTVVVQTCLFVITSYFDRKPMRRGMVYELERVLRVCNGFLCSISVTYDGAVLL